LTKYITSFSDNGLELKTYLNEEISRIREKMTEMKGGDAISKDEDLLEKAGSIIDMLEGFSDQKVSIDIISSVLKTQQLVQELEKTENDND